jgi:hypothetical protein
MEHPLWLKPKPYSIKINPIVGGTGGKITM